MGVIADFSVTEKNVAIFLLNKYIAVTLCVPACARACLCTGWCATQVERRAIKESALGAGAREVGI